jgi:hypothetical protein
MNLYYIKRKIIFLRLFDSAQSKPAQSKPTQDLSGRNHGVNIPMPIIMTTERTENTALFKKIPGH